MKALLPLLALGLSSCNITTGSRVVVGTSRPAISPNTVKIYLRPPVKFEEVAVLNAQSKNAFASDQSLTDSAIGKMRSEAAKLGANGVLLHGVGDRQVGSVANTIGSATAYQSGYAANAFASGTTIHTPVMAKVTSGTAIYVTKE